MALHIVGVQGEGLEASPARSPCVYLKFRYSVHYDIFSIHFDLLQYSIKMLT